MINKFWHKDCDKGEALLRIKAEKKKRFFDAFKCLNHEADVCACGWEYGFHYGEASLPLHDKDVERGELVYDDKDAEEVILEGYRKLVGVLIYQATNPPNKQVGHKGKSKWINKFQYYKARKVNMKFADDNHILPEYCYQAGIDIERLRLKIKMVNHYEGICTTT